MVQFAEPVNGVEVGLNDHMTSLINGLALTDHTHINGASPNTTSHMITKTTPTILYSGDQISQCCYGLQPVTYFDITSSARSVAELSLFNSLLSYHRSSPAIKADQLAALRQSIEHHCVTKDITQLSFYHYLLNMCFEQLPLDPYSQSLSTLKPLLYDTPLQLGTKLTGGTVALTDTSPPPTSSPPGRVSPSRTLDVPPSLWNMTEYSVQVRYDLPVLLQVIQGLHFRYPYTVMGHHYLTDSLLVALHSGHDGHLLQQYTHCDQLHCKVGFSKFLRYVWDKFGGDVSQATTEDEERRKIFDQQKKDDIAAVMKVIEEEQRAKTEEEQRQQQQSAKSTSGKGKTTNSGKKSAVSQKSATKQDSTEVKEEDERITVINNRVFPERKLYTGYEVNNKVLMVDHNVSSMFPLDGSQIRVHKKMMAEGDHSLEVALLSHQSILRCSLVLTESPATASSNTIGMVASPQPPVKCATFYASLDDDDLIITTSCYGPFGNGQVLLADDITVAPATADSQQQLEGGAQPSPRPMSRGQSPGRKVSKKDLEQYEKQMQEQQRLAEEKREKERLERERLRQQILEIERRQNKYLPLHITQRNGLYIHCKVVIDTDSDPSIMDGSDGQFIVRQSVQVNSVETQRCVLSTGEVIRYLTDGVVEVLTADGKIMRTATPTELAVATSSDHLPPMESATKVTFEDTVTSPPPEQVVVDSNTNTAWMVTKPTGERYLWRKGEKKNTPPAPPPKVDREQEEVSEWITCWSDPEQ